MDTGDNIKEAKWCDHVKAAGFWQPGEYSTVLVDTPHVHIVVEQGVVKILCGLCFYKAIDLREKLKHPSRRDLKN